jgi:hypothetical protein
MNKFSFIFKFISLALFLHFQAQASAKKTKSFEIIAFSNFCDNATYSKKIYDMISKSDDIKLVIDEEQSKEPEKFSMNLNDNELSLIKQNYSMKWIGMMCNAVMYQTTYTFAIVTDKPSSLIVLYGCDAENLGILRAFLIESSKPEISSKMVENLSIGPIKPLQDPFGKFESESCTCLDLHVEFVRFKTLKRTLIAALIACFSVALFIVLSVKIYKKITVEAQVPSLP